MLHLPVAGYSLDLQKAHTDFAEAKIGKRIIERQLEDEEINQLAVVAMAGATSEGMKYPEVGGRVLMGVRCVWCMRTAAPWGGGVGVWDMQVSAYNSHEACCLPGPMAWTVCVLAGARADRRHDRPAALHDAQQAEDDRQCTAEHDKMGSVQCSKAPRG